MIDLIYNQIKSSEYQANGRARDLDGLLIFICMGTKHKVTLKKCIFQVTRVINCDYSHHLLSLVRKPTPMHHLQQTIMADNSRLFACLENRSVTDQLIERFDHRKDISIKRPIGKKRTWIDLHFRNEEFSIFSGTGDLMFFAVNRNCPEAIIWEFLSLIG